jgi:hypothetical protein
VSLLFNFCLTGYELFRTAGGHADLEQYTLATLLKRAASAGIKAVPTGHLKLSFDVMSVGGYELNADLNAAYNIRNIHQALFGISLAGGSKSSDLSYLPIGLPIREVQAVRRKKTVVDLHLVTKLKLPRQ